MSNSMEQATSEVPENVRLHCLNETSDKIYLVNLELSGSDWVVNAANGRRGATLIPRPKSKVPGPYAVAKKIYDSLVREKMSGGYKVIGGAAPVYIAGAAGREHSGVHCQLLSPIDADAASSLDRDPAWIAQEKHDGNRMLILRSGDEIRAINRKGLYCGYPEAVQESARSLEFNFLIDGEAVGEQLRAFDVLEINGVDIRDLPAQERLERLASLMRDVRGNGLVLVKTAYGEAAKVELRERLIASGREGIVYKRASSPYEGGRGSNQVKFKLYETLSAVAGPENDKRSVGLRLNFGGEWVSIGNCTVPPNHKMPSPGTVVEIRYLYAYPGGGLAQPSYLGVRSDIDPEECGLDQLKYKSQEEIDRLETGTQETDPAPRP